jgi:hypothetical protein
MVRKQKIRNKTRVATLVTSFSTALEVQTRALRQEKTIQIRKEEV